MRLLPGLLPGQVVEPVLRGGLRRCGERLRARLHLGAGRVLARRDGPAQVRGEEVVDPEAARVGAEARAGIEAGCGQRSEGLTAECQRQSACALVPAHHLDARRQVLSPGAAAGEAGEDAPRRQCLGAGLARLRRGPRLRARGRGVQVREGLPGLAEEGGGVPHGFRGGLPAGLLLGELRLHGRHADPKVLGDEEGVAGGLLEDLGGESLHRGLRRADALRLPARRRLQALLLRDGPEPAIGLGGVPRRLGPVRPSGARRERRAPAHPSRRPRSGGRDRAAPGPRVPLGRGGLRAAALQGHDLRGRRAPDVAARRSGPGPDHCVQGTAGQRVAAAVPRRARACGGSSRGRRIYHRRRELDAAAVVGRDHVHHPALRPHQVPARGGCSRGVDGALLRDV
mmetsp:Transcript_60925/g.176244  ORF Transcript_60925/g.176244 Transcript_60925/m.176244 type:complete len:398 (+) Transcript_60925:736-1929(+)